ncbi:MAG: hypothetical protein E7458_07905 [Ruminococcaceae bacterium]|nr:hypothetical protein [Oscillospiraceae bacterium]
MKKVLIFVGGWDGHEPMLVSQRFKRLLENHNMEVDIQENQECLADIEKLRTLDLIIPHWTMGTIERDYVNNICTVVGEGVGLAGNHGGMCDAFRQSTNWQFMTGGQWVSHPGGDGQNYMVNICKGSSPLVEGLEDFPVCSEHYYLHIDPAVEVLATTRFPLVNYYHCANKPVDMPVAWTKYWGLGRVFYCSLGHHDDVFDKSPNAQELMLRGMLWAAEGRQYAIDHNLSVEPYLNSAKMY